MNAQQVTSYAYDTTGNLTRMTDAAGHVTQWRYDHKGRVLEMENPLHQITRYEYDAIGHLVRLTRPGGQVFTYTYDIMDRMREKTTPDDFVLYTYDALAGHGQLVAVSNSQAVVHFDYDNSARLTGERLEISTGGVGAPGPVNYALDAAGNVLSETISPHPSMNMPALEVSHDYDEGYRLRGLSAHGPAGVPGPHLTASYQYDTLGRVVQITKPDGTLSTFGYDAAGQLTQLRHLFGVGARQGTVFHRTLSQSVDIMGDISESQLLVSAEVNGVSLLPLGPGGVFSHAVSLSVGINPFRVRATDATGRPVERLVVVERMAGAGDTPGLLPVREGLQFDFSHDATGNITGLHDSRYGASNYQYDALQRLVAAARPPGAPVPAENYAYDPLGNRVSSHLSAAHAHDAANRLLNDDHYIYEYDAGGNRTARVRRADLLREEYIHNAENRLVGYMMLSGSEMLRQARYVYDGLGRRVARLVDLGGDGAADECVYYGYSGENVIREISCSYAGSLEPFAALGSFGASNSASTLLFHGPGIDQPIGFFRESGEGDVDHITGEDFYGMHADHLGSVEVITSYTGSALINYFYDSFGNIVKVTDTDGVELPLGQSQASYPLGNRFTYTGREHDPETGLYFYRARYYDPQAGRFLEEDPVFDGNLYQYANSNPIRYFDPTGEFAGTPLLWALFGALIIGLSSLLNAGCNSTQPIRQPINDYCDNNGCELIHDERRKRWCETACACKPKKGSKMTVEECVTCGLAACPPNDNDPNHGTCPTFIHMVCGTETTND